MNQEPAYDIHSIEQLIRKDIVDYVNSHAPRALATDYLRLHANESPFNSPENRYPETSLIRLKSQWGCHEGIPSRCCYLCQGTEEAIDLAMRIFCTPGQDEVIVPHPSRSIYTKRAKINGIGIQHTELHAPNFQLDMDHIADMMHPNTKMLLLCNPNSPTGNLLSATDIATLADLFPGMIVIDESYIEFCSKHTSVMLLNHHPNLIIIRSFSHAWASAAIRMAAVIAHPKVIRHFEQVGLTHPISTLCADYAERLVKHRLDVDKWVRQLIDERGKVITALKELPICQRVYPSETNFLLVKMLQCREVVSYLNQQHIAVAECTDSALTDCIRITISLPIDNSRLLGALRTYCELHHLKPLRPIV